ncbi:MAG: hypothetical protein NUV98_01890 [Candidatus Roizmanbacteria bacterium]|nr:hypothetical protein [Candidatus Roizmanbacteria bacterium]
MTEKKINIYAALEQSMPVSFDGQDFSMEPLENPFDRPPTPLEEIDTTKIIFPSAAEMNTFAQEEVTTLAERTHAFVDFEVGLTQRQREIMERSGQLIITASVEYGKIQAYQDAIDTIAARRRKIWQELQPDSMTTIGSVRRNELLARDRALEEDMAVVVRRISRFYAAPDTTHEQPVDAQQLLTVSKVSILRSLYQVLFEGDMTLNESLHNSAWVKRFNTSLDTMFASFYPPEHESDQQSIPLTHVDEPVPLPVAAQAALTGGTWTLSQETPIDQEPADDRSWQESLWQDLSDSRQSLRSEYTRATILPSQESPQLRIERSLDTSLRISGWNKLLGDAPPTHQVTEYREYFHNLEGLRDLARAFQEVWPRLAHRSAEKTMENLAKTVTFRDALHYGAYGTFDATQTVRHPAGADRRISRVLAVVARQKEIDSEEYGWTPHINHGKYLPFALAMTSQQFDSVLREIEQEGESGPKLYDVIDNMLVRLRAELVRNPEIIDPLLSSAANYLDAVIMQQSLLASREHPVSESTLAELQPTYITLNDAIRRTRTRIDKWYKSKQLIVHHYDTDRGERFFWAEFNDIESSRAVVHREHEAPIEPVHIPASHNAYALRDGTRVSGDTLVAFVQQLEQASRLSPLRGQQLRQSLYPHLTENQGMSLVYRRMDELRARGAQIQSFRIGKDDIGYYLSDEQRAHVLNVIVTSEKLSAISRTIEDSLAANLQGREILNRVEDQIDIHFTFETDLMRILIHHAIQARREMLREHSKETNLRNHEFLARYIDTLQELAVGSDNHESLNDEELISLQISLNRVLESIMSDRLGGIDMRNRIQTLNGILAAVLHLRREYPDAQFNSVDEDMSVHQGITFQMYQTNGTLPRLTHIVLSTNKDTVSESSVQAKKVSRTTNPSIFTQSRTTSRKLTKAIKYLKTRGNEETLLYIEAPGGL